MEPFAFGFEINPEDLEIVSFLVDELFDITSKIMTTYRRLATLEINKHNNTPDYPKTLSYLKRITSMENTIYQKMDPIIAITIKTYIDSNTKFNTNIKETTKDLIESTSSNLISKRVIFSLNEIIKQSSILTDIITTSSKESLTEDYLEELNNNNTLHLTIEKDYLIATLYYLEECIKNKDHQSIKKDLIKAKYNLLFVNRTLTKEAISYNFNFDELNITSKTYADYMCLPEEEYNRRKDIIASNNFDKEYPYLLLTTDLEYNDKTNYLLSLISQCQIKSSILLMRNDLKEGYYNTLIETFTNEEYLKLCPNSHISEALLLNCFKEHHNSLNKIRIYSLIPPKKL